MLKKIIVFYCVFSLLASPCFASLNFNGTTHVVNHGSAGSLDNNDAFTALMWVKTDQTGDVDFIMLTKGVNVGPRFAMNPAFAITAEYPRATVFLNINGSIGNFASWGADKWVFLAVSMDIGGVDGDQILMCGDLNTIATEPSSYATQTVGSGASSDDSAGDMNIGRLQDANRWIGEIASIMIFDTNLSVAEIKAQQFNLIPRIKPILFTNYGFNGTGTQIDLSGQAVANNGTVTGATVADHVPLGPPFGFNDERVFVTGPAAARRRVIQIF